MKAGPLASAGASFYKGHGLGNDYLVFRSGGDWNLTPAAIQNVCHPHRGIGGDGIVLLDAGDEKTCRLRMFNPDGSEFERSGNGLRILASFLAREGRVGDEWFETRVGGGSVNMRVHGGVDSLGTYDVSVEMGRVSFDPAAVDLRADALVGPSAGEDEEAATTGLARVPHPQRGTVEFTHVSVGNPHAVVFAQDLSQADLEELGPFLTSHAAFGQGTNVQLAHSVEAGRVAIRIWERGVGPTLASGTSACAVAAAAVRRGHQAPGDIQVEAPGGILQVRVTPDFDLVLRGPVEEVCTGALSPGLLARLRAGGG